MHTKYSFTLLAISFLATAPVHAGPISDAAAQLMVSSPDAAFKTALQKNDLRLITIPFCGGITPGFNFRSYSGVRPQENNLGIDCYSLLGDEDMEALQKLEPWVTNYNSLVYKELNNAK